MTRFDGRNGYSRFDPTIMLTILIGLAAAAFLGAVM